MEVCGGPTAGALSPAPPKVGYVCLSAPLAPAYDSAPSAVSCLLLCPGSWQHFPKQRFTVARYLRILACQGYGANPGLLFVCVMCTLTVVLFSMLDLFVCAPTSNCVQDRTALRGSSLRPGLTLLSWGIITIMRTIIITIITFQKSIFSLISFIVYIF